MLRRSALWLILTMALTAVAGGAALAAVPAGHWKGKLGKYTSTLTYTTKGSQLLRFDVPKAFVYCQYSGNGQVQTIYVPSVKIRANGTFSRTYRPKDAIIKLAGKVTGGTAHGTLSYNGGHVGNCGGGFTWSAHRG